jgi:oxygen-independent coproporphyrinogen-3 oxidase
MLGIRLAEGLPLDRSASGAAADLAAAGLLDADALAGGTARLTLAGRLLADRVARELLAAPPLAAVR